MNVIMLQHLSGDISHEVGKDYAFPTDEAIRLIDAGIAKPKNKKEYESALVELSDIESEKLEKEKQIAAIQYKDELLDEKHKLQERINAINEILGIKESIVIDEAEQKEEPKSGDEPEQKEEEPKQGDAEK